MWTIETTNMEGSVIVDVDDCRLEPLEVSMGKKGKEQQEALGGCEKNRSR